MCTGGLLVSRVATRAKAGRSDAGSQRLEPDGHGAALCRSKRTRVFQRRPKPYDNSKFCYGLTQFIWTLIQYEVGQRPNQSVWLVRPGIKIIGVKNRAPTGLDSIGVRSWQEEHSRFLISGTRAIGVLKSPAAQTAEQVTLLHNTLREFETSYIIGQDGLKSYSHYTVVPEHSSRYVRAEHGAPDLQRGELRLSGHQRSKRAA